MSRKATFAGLRTFIVHYENKRQTLYGPFASDEEAIVNAALTFASDSFLRLYLGLSAHQDTLDHGGWSIQQYTASEVNYFSADPGEGGYRSFKVRPPSHLPMTGSWPSAFRRYGPNTMVTVECLLAAMPEDAGQRKNAASKWMMAAAETAGLLSPV